ncbi:MAG: PKD domain-containing protein [Treponema sp.]|nr:PKD domain-containing protein [Candidatus Treponema caballi]
MKRRAVCVVFILLTFMMCAFGEDVAFSLTTDAAYYPLSAAIPAADGNRFCPVTGPYDGAEARTTFQASYTIPVPFGDNPLVSGNTLVLNGAFELTPITIKPGVSFSFTPIAFLVFSGGADVATGWDIGDGLVAAGTYNDATHKYDSLGAFNSCWYDAWFEGLFQFDLAAIVPGDWNHIVTQDSFRITYAKLAGQEDGHPWLWQASKEKVNGLAYTATFIVGYQMPLVLNTVAIQTEINGRFKDDMAAQYAGYKSDFTTYSVNPVFIFKFNEHNSLTTQLCFSSRRGFADELDPDTQSKLDMTVTGSEWSFYRIAFSWKYAF